MSVTIILGLRRSGTTIFWEWFRQDPRFVCFDEPHSEQLMRLPSEHAKGVFTEYRRIVRSSPADFWRAYAPIHRAEELDPFFAPRQRDYLQYLAGQGDDVVFDLTRCHLKVRELAELFPDASFLHLTRGERAFASSHLLPSRSDLRGRIQRKALERSFWSRTGRFDFWGMETLCGTGAGSKLSWLLDEADYDVPAFYRLPAVGRLIVLHRFLTSSANRALASVRRAATVSFDEFTHDPESTVASACAAVDTLAPVPTGALRPTPASPGYRPRDDRWDEVQRQVEAACPAEEQP